MINFDGNLEIGILALGAVGMLWIWAHSYLLKSFRRSLKSEQVVGVKFSPETIVNRRIVQINFKDKMCLVQDYKSDRLVMVELDQIYVADHRSSMTAIDMY